MAHLTFPVRFSRAASAPVRARDRLLDATAAVCIIAGAALFLVARRTLTGIAAGSVALPSGAVTHVAFTDSVVLRSRVGLWLLVVGAILALASALSHRFAKRA